MPPSSQVTRDADRLVYVGDRGNRFVPVWNFFRRKSNEQASKLAQLDNVKKLKVSGNINTSEIDTTVPMYEVVYSMILLPTATAWDVPLKLKLILPDGMEPSEQERTQNLVSKPKLQWLEVLAGEFKTENINMTGSIRFSLDIDSQNLNSGLVIRSVIVRKVEELSDPDAIKAREISPRELKIHRGQLIDHWKWNLKRESPTSNTYFEEAELVEIVWFEVKGKFDASRLPIGSSYKVVVSLRLDRDAEGWENNYVTFAINDNSYPQMIDKSLYQGEDFKDLDIGDVTVDQSTVVDGIQFSLSETKSGESKKGLIIKSVRLVPVF